MTTTTNPAASDALWVSEADYPLQPTPKDLEAFFGIPPDPPDQLDENIRRKRKFWKQRLNKGRSEQARRVAEAVVQAIADAEDALKRGADAHGSAPVGFDDAPARSGPLTVEEVWAELERLLFRNRYRDALDRVRDFEAEWDAYPAFLDIRSEVILQVFQHEPGVVGTAMLRSAIDASRYVLAESGADEARYLTLIELLDAAGRHDEAVATVDEAVRVLGDAASAVRMRQLELSVRSRPWTDVLRFAVELVVADPDDRAVRSDLAHLLVERARSELLPIDGEAALVTYREVVATAAWIAKGVPEAEDFVRAHRMWAANADQMLFGGNWQWRALVGVLTFLVGLPLLNRAMSKPAWQLLLAGPPLGGEKLSARKVLSRNRTWFILTNNGYLAHVHRDLELPWQQRANQWIELDPDTLFNF